MNITNMFQMQAEHDQRIEAGQQGKDLLPDKIACLIESVGKVLGAWRGHHYWSDDKKPHIYDFRLCTEDEGDALWCQHCQSKFDLNGNYEKVGGLDERKVCPRCLTGVLIGRQTINPLLEAYVEGLEWVLSIGNAVEADWKIDGPDEYVLSGYRLPGQFLEVNERIVILQHSLTFNPMNAKRYFWNLYADYHRLGHSLGLSHDQIEAAYTAHINSLAKDGESA